MKKKLPRKFEVARYASTFSNARHSRRVGAVLYSGSTLLSSGHNEYRKTHPSSAPMCNIHAEHRCLIRRRYYEDTGNLTMYVYRETADGLLACSKPCENCMFLMHEAGIKKVYYINEKGEIEVGKIDSRS